MGLGLGLSLLAVRSVQILCAAVVLGISGALVTDQLEGTHSPAVLTYAAFTGAFGLVAGVLGFAAVWIEALQNLTTVAINMIAALLYGAGGIVSLHPHYAPLLTHFCRSLSSN
jgi:hypothetical protein